MQWARAAGAVPCAARAGSATPVAEAPPARRPQFYDAAGGDEDGSSRASSPSKSPLLQSARFLDQSDQPLLRQPPGRSSFRASHQSGSDVGEHGRGAMQLGAAQPHLQQPSSPPVSQAQYNRWVQDSRAADRAAAVGAPAGRAPPNRRTLFGQAADFQQQQQQQSETSRSDGGQRQSPYGAAASDPMTYAPPAFGDGAPNLGDVTQPDGGQQWQIPAMRGGGGGGTASGLQHDRSSPGPSTISGRRGGGAGADKKPGAVVKLGRRQAWLKFLAYEVCLLGSGRACMLATPAAPPLFLHVLTCAAVLGALSTAFRRW